MALMNQIASEVSDLYKTAKKNPDILVSVNSRMLPWVLVACRMDYVDPTEDGYSPMQLFGVPIVVDDRLPTNPVLHVYSAKTKRRAW